MKRLNMGILPAPTGDHGYRLSSSAVRGIATLPNTPSIAGCRLLGRFPVVSPLRLGICRTPGASCDAVGAQRAGTTSRVQAQGPYELFPRGLEVKQMGRLPAWTSDVSDALADVQIVIDRAAEDGAFTADEHAEIRAAIHRSQQRVTQVHQRIAKVCSFFRVGDEPEYIASGENITQLFGPTEPERAELTG